MLMKEWRGCNSKHKDVYRCEYSRGRLLKRVGPATTKRMKMCGFVEK
jgi:hypothetical protein